MSQPINLNKVRKARAKTAARRTSDENAVKFGRSAEDKKREQAQALKQSRDLDGKRQE